jgi:hypothetical protein
MDPDRTTTDTQFRASVFLLMDPDLKSHCTSKQSLKIKCERCVFPFYNFNNLLVAVLMCLRDERADIRMAILELLHKLVTDRYT